VFFDKLHYITRTAALGLWECLSHSALLRLIVIVLKSHSASLRSIVIVLMCHSAALHSVVIGLKVLAAKTNDSKYNFCRVVYRFGISV